MKNTILSILLILSFQVFALSPLDIFSFEDSFECNDKFPHHSFCEATDIKPWKEEEKRIVKKYLSMLDKKELNHFYETIKTKGITKFHRVSYTSTWYNNISKRRAQFNRSQEKVLLWVNPVTNVVGFMDTFFENEERYDPFSPLPKEALNVFHEMVHIYDIARNHISTNDEFQNAVGWYWNGKTHVIQGIDHEAVMKEFNELIELSRSGERQLSYNLMRKKGSELGLPSLYSTFNTHECFAELVTHLIFDPYAKDYIRPEVQELLHKIISQPL